MNYNDDWREERRRQRENPNYNPRWDNRNERRRSTDSGYWNNDEFVSPHSGSVDRSEQRFESNWHGEQNNRQGRNPNWDREAPISSRYEGRNQFQDYDSEDFGNYGNTYEGRENQGGPNRNYSAQGMNDPRYGNPQFSDRQRRGSTGGSSNRHERGDYGNYTDFRSSGQNYESAPQGRYGTHTEAWDDDEDYRSRRSLGRRDNSDSVSEYSGRSFRGKGPKNYKRDDNRIKDDVNDVLTDHDSIDASDIDVDVKDGNVILSGHVENRQAKRRAETAIDYISGVKNVENRIHINSGRDSGNSGNSGVLGSRSTNDYSKSSGSGESASDDDNKTSTSNSSKSRNSKSTV